MKIFNSWHFTKHNYILFGVGLSLIMLGYILMLIGDTTSFLSIKLSPIILVIGYCVLIPLSIIINFNKKS